MNYNLGSRSDSRGVTQDWNEAELNQINIHSPPSSLAATHGTGGSRRCIQKRVKNVHKMYK